MYEKLGFTSGQTLKAEHLNYMEDGIASSVTAESIRVALGYTPADSETVDQLSEEIDGLLSSEYKSAIVHDVLAILDASEAVYVSVDESNNITLSGDLADGTYTLKYNNADGSTTDICTLTISGGSGEGGGTDEPETPTYTNLVPTAKTHTNLSTVFNSVGYMDGKYASSSSPYYGTDAATVCTGVFEAAGGDMFYIKGITLDASANNHCRVGLGPAHATNGGITASIVKAVNEMSTYATLETLGDQYYKLTILASYVSANLTRQPYVWISGIGTGANLIVTRNEPIE